MSQSPASPSDATDPLWRPENFAHSILESAGEGIVVYDREMRYRLWNRFMTVRTGLTLDQVYGKIAYELFPHLIPSGVVDLFARALAGETVHSSDERYDVRHNGRSGWFQGRYEPYYAADGTIAGVLGLVHETTERKEAEDRLRESERRFRTIIENSNELISILDAQGHFVYQSPSNERIMGWTAEESVSISALERVHPDDVARVRGDLARLLAVPDEVVLSEYRYRHKNGSWRHISTIGRNLLGDDAVRGVVLTTRDITDWRELQDRMHESQRIEAVGRLAGGIAHDFNNLLTVISGNAQLVLSSGSTESSIREEIEEIAHAAERAASLTQQLLAFSRQQVLQPRVLDLNVVVAEMWKLLSRVIGENIELVSRVEPALGAVMADPGQIEQVLLNLVMNARDAMPAGGRLIIETRNVQLDSEFVRHHAPMGEGRYVLLSVSDTGIGMSEDLRERVFEPFFTTKEKGKGTGLGLSTVYGIVKQSGGFIWVESEVGEGTRFHIYLPGVEHEAWRHPEVVRHAGDTRGSEAILIVEDEDLVRSMTRRTLEGAGYRVHVAASGREALALCAGDTPHIDLLLTDVVMPGMSGRELAVTLSRQRPGLRVLLMSGYTQDRDMHLAKPTQEFEFLQKPFTLEELRARVRGVLDRAEHGEVQ